MKTKNLKKVLVISLCTITMFACNKQATNKKVPSDSFVQNEESIDASVFRSTESGSQTLTLRPGLKDGQDITVVYDNSDPNTANTNQNHLTEVVASGWTHFGLTYNIRNFIKFDSLSLIPPTATILNAQLYLYGLSSSNAAPQGNSYYPGSPYFSYGPNSCYVSRVTTANWLESTMTWNNQPDVTTIGQAVIPESNLQWNYNAIIDVTAMVQKMVTRPSKNYGFRIKQISESPYHSIVFGSSEQTNKALRPKLKITYQ